VAGIDGWYRSDPVTVTLAATDSTSGPDQTFYRPGGGWTAGNTFALAGESVHSFEFYSTDQAGNGETPGSGTVKIDTTPPGVPVNPVADPAGWSKTDSFTITWNNPSDFSGVSGAYYKLNGAPTFPTDGTFVSTTNVITGISVGSESQHDLFLWLQDRAGNVDDASKNAVPKAFSYDHTPPTTTASVAGTLGDNNWYVTPVTVTFDAQDQPNLSGVAETRYRVGTAPTQTGASLVLTADDKHTVRYWSVDVAGNEEAANSRTIRADRTAPAAPINPLVTPTGWSDGPCFLVSWTLPPDTSGIQGVYYRFGAPPSADTDGTYVAGTGPLTCVLPPSEGKHDLHVWLKDNAGNLDFRNRADMFEAVWYDATPPTTTIQVTGTLGAGGWYASNVTVTLASTDTASGVVATHFRLDGGPWQVGNNLALASEGAHTVDFYADDVAGNVESTRQALVRIDSAAPSSAVNALPANQSNTTFGVSWVGDDGVGGSGIAQFDVQAKDGMAGPWQDWLTGVVATSANFNGQRGHVYFFRSRSRDVAGNQENYPGGDQHPFTFVQSFLNGDFSAGSFAGWVQGGGLGRGVIQGDGHALASATTWIAQLGDPSYGSGSQGNVPPNTSAYIYQEIDLPAFVDLPAPTLSFWYRVFTYDVVYGCPPGQTDPNDPSKCKVDPDFLYDSFDVTIEGDGITTVRVLRDGNLDRGTVGTLVDMGWRHGVVDLSAYAGRGIRVRFANWNRPDAYYNTWTYLDDVVVTSPGRGGYLVYLPLNTRSAAGFAATETLRSAPAGPGPRR